MKYRLLILLFLLAALQAVAVPSPADCEDTSRIALTRKARHGDSRAQYALAERYANGRGMRQSYPKAVKWYRKAAEHGYAPAQCRLGFSYMQGYGVSPSDPLAIMWYRRAAEQGNAEAMYLIGECYECGYGVPDDMQEAARWYIKSAALGYSLAIDKVERYRLASPK